jgi:Ca2+/Na+ antiporter
MRAADTARQLGKPRGNATGGPWWVLPGRLVLIVVGGYATASALVAGLTVTLSFAGLPRSEAVVLVSMLGFVIYLALLIWGFAERKLTRLTLGLALLCACGLVLFALMRHSGG